MSTVIDINHRCRQKALSLISGSAPFEAECVFQRAVRSRFRRSCSEVRSPFPSTQSCDECLGEL